MSATVEVTYAGLPIVAPQAASSMSTTGRGQIPSVSRRNSSDHSSSNLIQRPRTSPMIPYLVRLAQRLGTGQDVVAAGSDAAASGRREGTTLAREDADHLRYISLTLGRRLAIVRCTTTSTPYENRYGESA
jgi:hypothetical protein